MRRLLALLLVRWVYAGLRSGRPRRALLLFAGDARLRFAGTHTWAVDTTDEDQRRAWFQRFAALQPDLRARDVLVAGPPWALRIVVLFDDAVEDTSGHVVYRNQGAQYLVTRWGRVVLDEVHLDTQRVAELDALSR